MCPVCRECGSDDGVREGANEVFELLENDEKLSIYHIGDCPGSRLSQLCGCVHLVPGKIVAKGWI